MRKKRENKLLTTLFVILDYLIFYKENTEGNEVYPGVNVTLSPRDKREDSGEKRLDESFSSISSEDSIVGYLKTAEGVQIVDAVIGMAIYILLEFDWESVGKVVEDIGGGSESEGEAGGERRRSISVIGYIMRSLGKQIGKNSRNLAFTQRSHL